MLFLPGETTPEANADNTNKEKKSRTMRSVNFKGLELHLLVTLVMWCVHKRGETGIGVREKSLARN